MVFLFLWIGSAMASPIGEQAADARRLGGPSEVERHRVDPLVHRRVRDLTDCVCGELELELSWTLRDGGVHDLEVAGAPPSDTRCLRARITGWHFARDIHLEGERWRVRFGADPLPKRPAYLEQSTGAELAWGAAMMSLEVASASEQGVLGALVKGRGDVVDCYRARLAHHPGLVGELALTWRFVAGSPPAIEVREPTPDPVLAACVVAASRSWDFPSDSRGTARWTFDLLGDAVQGRPTPRDARP